MISMAAAVEDPRERVVQETLEAVTWPGESLIGFTQCRLNPGEFLDKIYCVGLTPRRFLLVCKEQPDRVFSIYRSLVERVRFIDGGIFSHAGLELRLGGKAVLLETEQPWNKRASQIVSLHNEWELESPYLTSTQFLESIADLSALGLLRPAQSLLRKHMAEDPVVEIEPRSVELDFAITQGRWSLWLSLGTLTCALLYSLGRVLCGAAWAGADIVPVVLLLSAAFLLVRWQHAWRGLALSFALMAALLNLAYSGFTSFAAASSVVGASLTTFGLPLVNGLAWTAFVTANILALTGRPGRARNLIATGIFAAGFLAPLLFTGFAAVAPILLGESPARFSDDFSADKGWIARHHGSFMANLENGVYAVQVKEANSTFFAFPPLRFVATQASLDAQVSEEFKGIVGTFGVTCGYTEREGAYLVEIDPNGGQYAFLKHEGETFTPLTATYWQPVSGTRIGQGMTHLDVRCAGKEIELSINGVEQGKASVPGFAWHGKMGLFVHTWTETGEQGLKVLFDNVDFERGNAGKP